MGGEKTFPTIFKPYKIILKSPHKNANNILPVCDQFLKKNANNNNVIILKICALYSYQIQILYYLWIWSVGNTDKESKQIQKITN